MQREASCGFLKLLFTKDRRIYWIDEYHRRVSTLVGSFEISGLLDVQVWKARNDNARTFDQRAMNERLNQLERDWQRLTETLSVDQQNAQAMMVSLKKRLRMGSDAERERRFFTHVLQYLLQYLTTCGERQVELETWMITSYEVEFGPEIGSGGFGKVFKGKWNNTMVALKVLVIENGIAPSPTSIHNEIEIWSTVQHPNVVQFLGANILDDKPFIVMPYFKNGNSRDYLQKHPDSDRLQILHGISLGLFHLHSHHIVHGDLKGLNVLIDDSPKAILCDFGLSRVKADATSRTVTGSEGGLAGSLNWMAPELLQGGSLKTYCDIYAFGMTLYEIFVDAVPLAHIIHAGFFELVVGRNVRPERPDDGNAPQLSDAVWKLAERCWVKDPKSRPTARTICDTLSHIIEARAVMSSSSSHQTPKHQWVHLPSAPPSPAPNLTMRGHTDVVVCTAFSPDGKLVVSGSLDGRIIVWNAQTGNPALPALKKHSDAVCSLAFSPNGRQIASGSFDKSILIWDLTTGQVVAGPFLGHTDSVWAVCLSPDGKQIASGSGDNTVRLWNMETGHLLLSPLIGHTNGVYTAAFSGDGKRLVSGSTDNTVRIWDVRSGRPIHGPLRGHRNWVYFVGFSNDGNQIISASWEGDICVWNTGTGALMSGPSKQHMEHTAAVMFTPISTCCAVSPDGKWVAGYTHSDGQVVRVWDTKTGQLAGTFTEHAQYVHNVSFSPDSKRVLSSSDDKTVQIHTIDW